MTLHISAGGLATIGGPLLSRRFNTGSGATVASLPTLALLLSVTLTENTQGRGDAPLDSAHVTVGMVAGPRTNPGYGEPALRFPPRLWGQAIPDSSRDAGRDCQGFGCLFRGGSLCRTRIAESPRVLGERCRLIHEGA